MYLGNPRQYNAPNVTTIMKTSVLIKPDSFHAEKHWYPKALNAQIHPAVSFFMHLGNERIASRYAHLNPKVDKKVLLKILSRPGKFFRWGGTDLMRTVTASGRSRMVVIETNSCPSGQKSFPVLNDSDEQGGYRRLMESTFLPLVSAHKVKGALAVFYDKNDMEAEGYAAAMADVFGEDVHLAEWHDEPESPVRIKNGMIEVYSATEEWIPVRAAFRYVTQRPWNRIPVQTKTLLLNPIISCLAGGRNKLVAAKAYNLFNAELSGSGLEIATPKTIWDVNKNEVRLWVKQFGGKAVVKIPYGNAGQGVYPITSERELDDFMSQEFAYDKFIVQSLIGNYNWSSSTETDKFYQTGTVPSAKGNTFVFDLRMMVVNNKNGFSPMATYARKALIPMTDTIESGLDSRDMLITNLSGKQPDGTWTTDTSRLLLMDRKDFNRLGISLDDLISGYIQSVLAVTAIDNMAQQLISTKKKFKRKLFASLNDDDQLLGEILP